MKLSALSPHNIPGVQWVAANIINKIPGWLTAGIIISGSAAITAFENDTNLFSDLQHWSTAWPDIRSALVVGGIAFWTYLKTDPWTKDEQKKIAMHEAPTGDVPSVKP